MPPPHRRALTRVLALTLAVASVTLLGPAAHPYLAPNGRSGMHADAAGSGTHP